MRGCGEWNETTVDPSAETRQTYIEDCQVCCKPNVLRVAWDKKAGCSGLRCLLK